MRAFLALLHKEFILRRKSCCAVFVNLILPLGMIFIPVLVKILTLGMIFTPSGPPTRGPDDGYSLSQDYQASSGCPDYSKTLRVKYYVTGLEMDEMEKWMIRKPGSDFNSWCSIDDDRCVLGIDGNAGNINKTATDVDQLIQATKSETLSNLCYGSPSTTNPKCDSEDSATFGLYMNYKVQDSVLDLTYFVADSIDLEKDEDLTNKLMLFHFTAMNNAYRKLSSTDFRVFLNFERDASPEISQSDVKVGDGAFMAVPITIFTMLSLIVPVRGILYEKRSKLKDLMHMSGVGNFKYYASYFVIDVVILLIFNLLQIFFNFPVTYEYYVFTVMYSVAATLFAIAFTVFFTRELFGLLVFSLILVFDVIVSTPLSTSLLAKTPYYVKLLLGIYPSLGLKIGFHLLDSRQMPQFILISIIVSWFFYNFIIFYIGEVWPWQSGTARSLLFPLAKLKPSLTSKKLDPDKNAGSSEFEPEPNDLKVGIEVNNVKKRYGFTKMVLKGVFLKVFHGQISVLLGHNGAGKTTLMSIITGLESASSGKVLINGIDTDYEPTKARKGIGMCPQINTQYDNLSVRHHLKFFALLKGFPQSKLNQEIYRVLDLVKLRDAEDRKSKALSGGMKRRLQLGMAFIGGSRILILDEPSSGLDVEARRVVWDMLLAVKREYLIFMTTHHMEEADCLGDRVIIMHDGEIRCIGSPMFLKKVYGVGLILRVSKGDNYQSQACLEFIRKYINSATLTKETRTEVLYLFAKSEESNLPQFFKDLDPMRSQLGINSCGVSIITMDDVFVRVGQKYDVKKGDESKLALDSGQIILKPTFCKAFYGLLVKRFHVTKRSKLCYFVVVLSLLFGILFGLFFLRSSYAVVKRYNGSFELDVKYGYTCIPKESSVCKITFNDSSAEESAFTIEVKDDPENSSATCLLLIPKKGHELTAITKTFQMLLKVQVNSLISATGQRMVRKLSFYILAPAVIIMWGVLLLLIPFRAVHAEKRTNVKLLQLMTGISPITYWLSHFVFDYLLALVISSPMLLFPPVFYFADYHLVLNEISSAALYYLGFLYFIFSCIIWSYIVSTLPVGPAAGLQLLIYYCLLGYLPGQMLAKIGLVYTKDSKFPVKILYYGFILIYWLIRISPHSQFEEILVSVFDFSGKSAFCKNLFQAFDKKDVCSGHYWETLSNLCCNGMDSGEPWRNLLKAKNSFSKPSSEPLESYVIPFVLAQIVLVVFIVLIFGLEYLNIAVKKRTSQVRHSVGEEDSDVLNERMATESVLAANGQINKAMMIKDLTKKYGKRFVVNRLTVTIEKDQIFGFLGVNGAGKTTAFKMMVGEINRTGGEAYIGQYSLSKHFQTYRAQIGYCPQFDTFVTGLTGMEMLYLFARLRGIQKSQLKQTVDQMTNLVDLQDYARVLADSYSGGNKRKLSAAMALIGYPKVIFLDEPTAAVDPVARRKIWKVMEYARQATGSSIVLTSHALDECEALCEKIVVMVAGQLKCLGSLQHLKDKFGQGLHITAKTKPGYNNLPQVQEAIVRMVQSSKVVDSHTNITILHVTDPQVKIGDVYNAMEQIRSQFDLEDYQVEETNLEQIFLYFAKAAYQETK